MAGCFGSHPFDRAMEQLLYRHLAWESDYESLCEEICKKVPDELWDQYDDYANKIVDKYLAVRVERALMSMEEAQELLVKMIQKVDASQKYVR